MGSGSHQFDILSYRSPGSEESRFLGSQPESERKQLEPSIKLRSSDFDIYTDTDIYTKYPLKVCNKQ